jgi:hypothetical protein
MAKKTWNAKKNGKWRRTLGGGGGGIQMGPDEKKKIQKRFFVSYN